MSKGRILIAPQEIAGFASRLQTGLMDIGWDVDVLDIPDHPFSYSSNPPNFPLYSWVQRLYRNTRGGSTKRYVAALLSLPLRALFSVRQIAKYDAIIYLAGNTICFGLDAWIARRSSTRTIMVFLGSDSRPPYMDIGAANVGTSELFQLSRRRKARVRKIERSVDEVVCSPTTAHFLSRPFVNWFAIGFPMPKHSRAVEGDPDRSGKGPLKILHAPSDPEAKGTALIQEAVRQLGIAAQLVLITGQSNSDVTRALASADLVVDQLYADTPFPSLASEAAAAGVPVLLFCNEREPLVSKLAARGIPTHHYQDNRDLVLYLSRARDDAEWLDAIAKENLQFANVNWDAQSVAIRLEKLVTEGPEADWREDPKVIDYVWGGGISREDLISCWTRLLNEIGPHAFVLPPENPALLAILEEIAGHSSSSTNGP